MTQVACNQVYWLLGKAGANMSMQSVPISEFSHQILCELTERCGLTTVEVLDKALDGYRRKLFLEEMNDAYAKLRSDSAAWAAIEEERRSMSGCLMDGLDPKEAWGETRDLVPTKERKEDD